ncbi:MAG TPA: alpha/beta fold hydrolase [Streptosporangiaceae bacterium]
MHAPIAQRNGWLRTIAAGSEATFHVVCFPPAGGGSGAFSGLRRAVGPNVRCTFIILPGRDSRFAEPMQLNMYEVADEVVRALSAVIQRPAIPYIVLGLSMGGVLAYEAALRIASVGLQRPMRVVVAGTPSPTHQVWRLTAEMDPTELMIATQGVRAEVFESAELAQIASSALAADQRMMAAYRCGGQKLDVPLTVMLGTEDPLVTDVMAVGWEQLGTAGITFRPFAGGHFFLDRYYPQLLAEWQLEAAELAHA